MKEAILCLWALLLLPGVLSTQVLTDTLWSVPELDGDIAFRPGSGIFNMGTLSADLFPGDGFDVFLGEEVFERSFLAFDLSGLSYLDTSLINTVTINVYQIDAIGNDWNHTYPIWNVTGGDTHFCVLDHIDYGNSLDLNDWTAGDPSDPQTLNTNIGVISDNAEIEYKTMDVIKYVKEDIANERTYNQYRMRFTIDTDFDHLTDGLIFRSGNSIVSRPYLAIQYDDTTKMLLPSEVSLNFHLKQNYPNPFNPITTIAYMLPKTRKIELTIFDLTGRKVQTLINGIQPAGSYEVQFDGSKLSSGVYWYRLQFEREVITKKMVIIR